MSAPHDNTPAVIALLVAGWLACCVGAWLLARGNRPRTTDRDAPAKRATTKTTLRKERAAKMSRREELRRARSRS